MNECSCFNKTPFTKIWPRTQYAALCSKLLECCVPLERSFHTRRGEATSTHFAEWCLRPERLCGRPLGWDFLTAEPRSGRGWVVSLHTSNVLGSPVICLRKPGAGMTTRLRALPQMASSFHLKVQHTKKKSKTYNAILLSQNVKKIRQRGWT